MKITLPQSKTYMPGPMRCIYCGKDGVPLSREHIIPRKMGGAIILHNASCTDCAYLINKTIENPALNGDFVSPRTLLGIPTSRPKETLPVLARSLEAVAKNEPFQIEHVKVEDHHGHFVTVQFAEPRILWSLPAVTSFRVVGLMGVLNGRPKITREIGAGDLQNSITICRFIAKIAHGAAVAELGFDAFEHLLPTQILGAVDGGITQLIGNGHPSSIETDFDHQITLFLRNGYVMAKVWLLARVIPVPYLAVVGRAGPELAKWNLSARITLPTTPK